MKRGIQSPSEEISEELTLNEGETHDQQDEMELGDISTDDENNPSHDQKLLTVLMLLKA